MTRCARVLLVLSLAVPVTVSAQGVPRAGQQFQVNAHTTSNQFGWARDVGADPEGRFVVTWMSGSSGGSDTDDYSIQAQRFSRTGKPLGAQVQVNTYTSSTQSTPAVGVSPDGSFTVLWESFGSNLQDGDGSSVQGRRYADDGVPFGPQFEVNTYTTGAQGSPTLGFTPAGKAVLAWSSQGSSGTDALGGSIQGRFFDPLTGPDAQLQINTYTTGEQRAADVAAGPGGFFLVVWESFGSSGTDGDSSSIQGRPIDPLGTPLATDFQLNSYTTGSQANARAAVATDGGALVTWDSAGSPGTDADGRSIQARFAAALGPAVEFQVNTYTTGRQDRASVSAEPDGGFVVVWQSYGENGVPSSWSIHGQRLDQSGQPVAAEFQVESYTTSYQFNPSVAGTGPHAFVVIWESGASGESDSDGTSIQGQRFGAAIFADAFESGDGSVWSSSEPPGL